MEPLEILFLILIVAVIARNAIKDKSDGRSITGAGGGGRVDDGVKKQRH